MRIIKFRAWDTRVGKWYENINAPIVWGDGFDRKKNPYIAFAVVPDGVILQQFTGLFDKDGREIFEGDIVKDKNGEISQIYYSQEYAQFVRGNTIGGIFKNIHEEQLDVIGNIYENLELLN